MGWVLPIGAAGLTVVAKRAAKDMFPTSNSKGYMSTPKTSVGQACKAAPHAPLERIGDPTLPFLWPHCSKSYILSSRDHCKVWV